ncbi:MAG: menaquinone biosynthesis protein [bacterium]|nr:menaquinone biosynthesis protein [bacterium]
MSHAGSAGSRRARLGAISFLNTRPLMYGLEEAESLFDIVYDVPSACADALSVGAIDVGLIPAVEYARHGSGLIVPDLAIGAVGEVLTVRLFYRGELGRIRRIAADTSSRTSVALLRILLHAKYDITPEFVPSPPDLDAMLHGADAALLIGDPVLPLVETGDGDTGRHSLDLGHEWFDFTGHPFVFAFWSGAEGALSATQVARLQRARQEGEQHLPEIAAAFQRERAGSAELYERYLHDHICYDLGEQQIAGLKEFYRLAFEQGIISEIPPLRFYPNP